MFGEDGWTRLVAPGTGTTVVRRRVEAADAEGDTGPGLKAAGVWPAPVGDAAGDDEDNPDDDEGDSDDRA